jgi:hypothetical protein
VWKLSRSADGAERQASGYGDAFRRRL